MELMQEEVKGYCDSREEEEEEEATEEIITREENSSRLLHQHQDVAGSNFIINNHHHRHHQNHHQHATKQLDFMDLSLATNKDNTIEANLQGSGIGVGGGASSSGVYAHHHQQQQQLHHASGDTTNGNHNNLQQQQPAEKEHMFDKVVTPSDVGKLNRLVIPKQHAEKYFPLDSSSNEKGLLLNFEDRNGKLWRFRYSYWNSSQSYVMTKGWSRFVKEKKLDAGDIVSFQRGVGEMYRHRLYIDWRRRPDHRHHHHHGHGPDPSTTLFTPLFLPNQPHLMSIRWGATSAGRLYSLPSPTPPTRHHDHLQQHHLNYNSNIMYHHQQQHPFHHQSGNGTHHYTNYHDMSSINSGSGSVFYLRSTPPSMPMVDHQALNTRQQQQQEGGNVSLSPMIIDSVPVAHNHHHHYHGGKSGSSNSPSTAGKRLRLFGVNMECASSTSDQDPKCFSLLSSSSSHVTMANSNSPLHSSSLPSPLQLLREDTTNLSSSPSSTRFGDQRGEASMLFDLDPSLKYRQ